MNDVAFKYLPENPFQSQTEHVLQDYSDDTFQDQPKHAFRRQFQYEETDDRMASGSESDGEDQDWEQEKTVRDKFKAILNKIMSAGKGDAEKTAQEIKTQFYPYLDKKVDERTILHRMAKDARRDRMDIWVAVLKMIIQEFPALMKTQDEIKETPLHAALHSGRSKLVIGMCDAIPPSDFDEILLKKDRKHNNCLHTALLAVENSPIIALELLRRINNPDKVLCELNGDGLSPLHIAVEYQRCTTYQLGVVQGIIDRCNKSLDIHVSSEDPNKLSVYLYHEKTRKESEIANNGQERNGWNPVQATPRPLDALTQDSGSFHQRNVSRSDIGSPDRSSTLSIPASNGSERRLSGDYRRRSSVTETSANAIRDLLKVCFICGRTDPEKILSFLYKPTEVKEIYFSLPGGPNCMVTEDMLEMMSYLEFEDTLRYVHIPMLRVEKTGPAASRRFGNRKTAATCKGRDDYVKIFDWLKSKGVKRIAELRVDDLQEEPLGEEQEQSIPSHSDEKIERALDGIEVLHTFDWKKVDLSSETIWNVAKQAVSVVLYWGGNDAILRGWSESEGFPKFKSLKKVTVYGENGLETSNRATQNLQKFKARLCPSQANSDQDPNADDDEPTFRDDPETSDEPADGIEVKCILDEKLWKSTASERLRMAAQEQPKEQHDWLTTMDKFATFIQSFRLDPSAQPSARPIRVALIDDGIDVAEKSLQGKVYGGRSFCQQLGGGLAPHYNSDGGHGTVMASLICRICPTAKLFVVRLDEYRGMDGRRSITAESAAKAVRAAVAQGVDIISMSWTIEKTDTNKAAIERLSDAINEAVDKNIILFCAANDQISDDYSYPGMSTKFRFKIGAATRYRQKTDSMGNIPVDFILPGQDVLRGRPGQVPMDKCNLLSGSSVSTALAAGLAALILYTVQLAAQHTAMVNSSRSDNWVTMDDFNNLRSHENMFAAINQIPKDSSSGNKFLLVNRMFRVEESALRRPEEEKLMFVQELARRLTFPSQLSLV